MPFIQPEDLVTQVQRLAVLAVFFGVAGVFETFFGKGLQIVQRDALPLTRRTDTKDSQIERSSTPTAPVVN